MKQSPLAPKITALVQPIKGVRYAAAVAGVKYQNRLDVMLMHFAPASVMAGVFTKSATRSAPVLHSQNILASEGNDGIAVLVNSGNSNAFTGKAGADACKRCITSVADKLAISSNAVHMASTGVIGEVLPDHPIVATVDELIANLSSENGVSAAQAILTTDTFVKISNVECVLDDVTVKISGFAKGSGMIAPDMATMLGFLASDVKIERALLQKALTQTTYKSFNAITVDSDTSTSDSVYFGATGAADMSPITDETDPRFAQFTEALSEVMVDLAQQIVRDGEGASKFVEVIVNGATNDASAKNIAMAIANSPLVKTAIAGEDPNWGRIVMAVGKAGEPAERDCLSIYIGDILVAEKGCVHPNYTEADTAEHMKGDYIIIRVDLGLGNGKFTAWTCDFTKRYIEINADYRS